MVMQRTARMSTLKKEEKCQIVRISICHFFKCLLFSRHFDRLSRAHFSSNHKARNGSGKRWENPFQSEIRKLGSYVSLFCFSFRLHLKWMIEHGANSTHRHRYAPFRTEMFLLSTGVRHTRFTSVRSSLLCAWMSILFYTRTPYARR